ncbi:MAG TPA: PP2C family protein-serine/threonine phosphatase [Coriobacteriia bacterium]|jgi:hypothetical protein
MLPDVHLTRWRAAAVALALVVSLAATGVLDGVTGVAPDLTILYLLPLLAATYFFGLRTGLTAALGAWLTQMSASLLGGTLPAPRALLDSVLHALVFALVVVGTHRALEELRTIRRLEGLRDLDLEIARRAHAKVIGDVLTERRDIDVGSRLRFVSEVGGDYYWFDDLDPTRSFLCVADISGKGIVAALFTALLDQSVRHAAQHSCDVTDIVRRVNRRVCDVLPSNMFVTLFAAVVADGRLTWLNAGHEPALLWRRRTGLVETLQTDRCLPLGVQEHLEGEAGSLTLDEGDVLLALTDGVTESHHFRSAGREALEDVLHATAAAGHTAEGIIEAVCREAADEDATDDIAVVCLRYLGEERGTADEAPLAG